jgi:FkbM family methyltransferase
MRLTQPGDLCLDIGGNIGYMALVLALSSGPKGRVLCFEPNVQLHPMLLENIQSWAKLGVAPIEMKSIALSDRAGTAQLSFPDDYEANRGVASLEHGTGGVTVETAPLDSLNLPSVGVAKIDVEGHEASVFRGAANSLRQKSIRDLVFEEHAPFPASSHKILLEFGYSIFRLGRSLRGPILQDPAGPHMDPNRPQNFLATADPKRVRHLFSARGWKALS